MNQKLMVIDGNAILTRAFYGIKDLTTTAGRHTNAIYGFLKIMGRVIKEEHPDAICVTFDVSKDTFRKRMYPAYKANRHQQPDELREQMAPMKEILRAMRIPVYELEGWEADDLIGTIAASAERADWQTIIVTGDKDALQLITCDTSVKLIKSGAGKTQTILYTPERFYEEYGFSPANLIDLKALMGDKSDNIPGVAGIGEKTAMALVQRYGSIEEIYRSIDFLTTPDGKPHRASVRKHLENGGRCDAELSQNLATIRRNAPIDFAPDDAVIRPYDTHSLRRLFELLELKSFIDEYHLH